jgi:hypothetical protein
MYYISQPGRYGSGSSAFNLLVLAFDVPHSAVPEVALASRLELILELELVEAKLLGSVAEQGSRRTHLGGQSRQVGVLVSNFDDAVKELLALLRRPVTGALR